MQASTEALRAALTAAPVAQVRGGTASIKIASAFLKLAEPAWLPL